MKALETFWWILILIFFRANILITVIKIFALKNIKINIHQKYFALQISKKLFFGFFTEWTWNSEGPIREGGEGEDLFAADQRQTGEQGKSNNNNNNNNNFYYSERKNTNKIHTIQ